MSEEQITYSKLVQDNDSPDKKQSRWETLYQLAQIQQDQRKKLQEQAIEEKQVDKECTFKPIMASSFELKSEQYQQPFLERQRQWNEKKDQKILSMREENKDKDVDGLTFKPTVYAYNHVVPEEPAQSSAKGIESFIRRQHLARQYKLQKELLQENPYSHLSGEKKGFVGREKNTLATQYETRKNQKRQSFYNSIAYSGDKNILTEVKEKTINYYKDSPEEKERMTPTKLSMGEAIKMLHEELHKISFNNEFE